MQVLNWVNFDNFAAILFTCKTRTFTSKAARVRLFCRERCVEPTL